MAVRLLQISGSVELIRRTPADLVWWTILGILTDGPERLIQPKGSCCGFASVSTRIRRADVGDLVNDNHH